MILLYCTSVSQVLANLNYAYIQVIFFRDSDWLDCEEAWNSENAQYFTEAFCLLLSYNSLM